jgi:hypothetical protein
MAGIVAAIIGLALKLWGLFRKPTAASPEAVAAANAAQERTVAQVDASTAQAEQRMAQAVVDAPSTQAEVVTALQKGEF